ncbi:MAG: CopG family transcriptional regulator [Pseudomonadota bacterium]
MAKNLATTVTVRVSPKQRTDLLKISKEEHISVGDIVRNAIDSFLAVKKFRLLRKKVLPFAEAEGLLTDEDIFKAIS